MPSNIIIADENTPQEQRNACMRILEKEVPAMVRHHPVHFIADPTDEQMADAKAVIFPTPAAFLSMAHRDMHRKTFAIAGTKVSTFESNRGHGDQSQVVEVFAALLVACLRAQPKDVGAISTVAYCVDGKVFEIDGLTIHSLVEQWHRSKFPAEKAADFVPISPGDDSEGTARPVCEPPPAAPPIADTPIQFPEPPPPVVDLPVITPPPVECVTPPAPLSAAAKVLRRRAEKSK